MDQFDYWVHDERKEGEKIKQKPNQTKPKIPAIAKHRKYRALRARVDYKRKMGNKEKQHWKTAQKTRSENTVFS